MGDLRSASKEAKNPAVGTGFLVLAGPLRRRRKSENDEPTKAPEGCDDPEGATTSWVIILSLES